MKKLILTLFFFQSSFVFGSDIYEGASSLEVEKTGRHIIWIYDDVASKLYDTLSEVYVESAPNEYFSIVMSEEWMCRKDIKSIKEGDTSAYPKYSCRNIPALK